MKPPHRGWAACWHGTNMLPPEGVQASRFLHWVFSTCLEIVPWLGSLQQPSFPHRTPSSANYGLRAAPPRSLIGAEVFKRIEETLCRGKQVAFAWLSGSRRDATQTTRQLQRWRCQALLHVHLSHPLLTQSHPAGLGLIKTMLGEARSHLEDDCFPLLPNC